MTTKEELLPMNKQVQVLNYLSNLEVQERVTNYPFDVGIISRVSQDLPCSQSFFSSVEGNRFGISEGITYKFEHLDVHYKLMCLSPSDNYYGGRSVTNIQGTRKPRLILNTPDILRLINNQNVCSVEIRYQPNEYVGVPSLFHQPVDLLYFKSYLLNCDPDDSFRVYREGTHLVLLVNVPLKQSKGIDLFI